MEGRALAGSNGGNLAILTLLERGLNRCCTEVSAINSLESFEVLKEEVKAKMKLYKPQTLVKMMSRAQMVEDKNQTVARIRVHNGGKTTNSYKSSLVRRIVMMEPNACSCVKGIELGGNLATRAIHSKAASPPRAMGVFLI
ncbi:hypothetical protein SESBI_24305 [Sesbania bispinosa]|nr:hypothetical protein SESBI_24305 [Sesbania bispinosa]